MSLVAKEISELWSIMPSNIAVATAVSKTTKAIKGVLRNGALNWVVRKHWPSDVSMVVNLNAGRVRKEVRVVNQRTVHKSKMIRE